MSQQTTTSGVQPQILQLPVSIVSSSNQNQITYNHTAMTQSTKTTVFKSVSSADGSTVYTIPSSYVLQNPTFMTTTASGELQVGGFKIENN